MPLQRSGARMRTWLLLFLNFSCYFWETDSNRGRSRGKAGGSWIAEQNVNLNVR
jgi:hypothetical protein